VVKESLALYQPLSMESSALDYRTCASYGLWSLQQRELYGTFTRFPFNLQGGEATLWKNHCKDKGSEFSILNNRLPPKKSAQGQNKEKK
jgi:hypothetical protein